MAKLAVLGVIAILCVNMSCWLVSQAQYDMIHGANFLPNITPSGLISQVDINGTLTPSPDINTQFYDIWGSMGKAWSLLASSVLGVPLLLLEFNCPTALMLVLDALYLFVVALTLVEFISGKESVID